VDEAGKNIDWSPVVKAYVNLATEIDRQVFAPLRRAAKSFLEVYGDHEVEWHGVTMPLREAFDCLRDQDLYGEAFVMLDGDGRGHRIAPDSIRVVR
jgi:hypothetical protein